MVFELNDSQMSTFREWAILQVERCGGIDCSGFRFCFMFIPSGLGDTVSVKDLQTGDILDLTDYSDI